LEKFEEQSLLIREQKETIAESKTQLMTMSKVVFCIAKEQTRLVTMVCEHMAEKKQMEMDAAVVDPRKISDAMKNNRKIARKERTEGNKRPSNPVSLSCERCPPPPCACFGCRSHKSAVYLLDNGQCRCPQGVCPC
jgi:hypothetical protein